jgi:hypothetical protein
MSICKIPTSTIREDVKKKGKDLFTLQYVLATKFLVLHNTTNSPSAALMKIKIK